MSGDIVPNFAQAGLAVPALILADGLSYEDYFKQINKMAEQMRTRWRREEKVGALKIAIQLSKLLADTSQLKLYSKKYSRVMEILDEFGKYIYERVHSIADGDSNDRTNNDDNGYFDSSELAKDIYRNWQFKILSIRELVPRFYTEVAILKASDILFTSASKSIIKSLHEQFYLQSLNRLSNYCVGLGDPIVSLHARAYLCRVAERLLDWNDITRESILLSILASNLKSSATLVCRLEMSLIHYPDLNMYFELLSGSFQSILNIITVRYNIYSDDERFIEAARAQLLVTLDSILTTMTKEDPCGFRRNVILNSLLISLPSDITSKQAFRFLEELRLSHDRWNRLPSDVGQKDHMMPTIYTTLSNFLTALDGSDTFEEQPSGEKLELSVMLVSETIVADLLRHSRGCISSNYLRCFKAILTFAAHHAPNVLDRPLTTLVCHMMQGRQYTNHYAHIMDIIKTLFTQYTKLDQIKSLVVLRSFNQLFDFLRKDEHRLDVAKYIIEMLRSNIKLNNKEPEFRTIKDRVIINFLLKLFDAINGSVSPLAAHEDLSHLSEIIVFFIELVEFDDILELIEFYSRCRGSLGNLNQALMFLVERVMELPQAHRKTEKRRNARQNILNCCLAFTFTTLPAIHDQHTRVRYYLQGCKLALTYKSISLADYFMRQIMVNLLGRVESYELQQQRSPELDSNQSMTSDKSYEMITMQVSELLELMIGYQDFIDLKHKLALSQLIRVSFRECSNLLHSLNNLNCVDEDNDDDKRSASASRTINNIEMS